MPGRLRDILVWPVWVGGAIRVAKLVKQCRQGIFGLNRCVVAHGFEGGPGVRVRCGPKSTGACKEAWENPSVVHLVRWEHGKNGMNEEFLV